MGRLRSLPVQKSKIDRSFVVDVCALGIVVSALLRLGDPVLLLEQLRELVDPHPVERTSTSCGARSWCGVQKNVAGVSRRQRLAPPDVKGARAARRPPGSGASLLAPAAS